MSDDDDLARLLFWPLFVAGVGFLLTLIPSTAVTARTRRGPTGDVDGMHLFGLACMVVGCIQMIVTTLKWWRRRRPKG